MGWESCLLGDALEYGKTIKAEPETIGDDAWVLELEDIEKDTSRLVQRHYFSERKSKSTKNTFFAGDVLYGKLRPYLNKVLLADAPGYCSTEIIPLSPGEHLTDGYIFYWLKSPEFLEYTSEVSHGINMPRLGTEAGLKAPLVLAPLNEQRRIAAKLDTTLAAVDASRQRLDGVAAILKRFRQAVLAAATSGELTQEWREERGADVDWPDVQLGDHAEGLNYGTSAKSQSEGEIPVLRMGNIQAGEIDWQDLIYTSDLSEIVKYMLDPGDVLFNRTNSPELVGKTAIYRGEQPAIYAGYLIRVRCAPSLDPEFLNLSLNSPRARDYCWRVKSDGVSQSNINAKKLAAYPFQLPPIEEQQEIVRRAQHLFTLADQLEARLTAARKVVDRLTPALLAKAFRGELVPQDPNDEPASVLLERIRAARQAEAATGKPSRRGRRQAAANPASSPVVAAPVTPDRLATLLRECGALSERALLAASELDPASFQAQLAHERSLGAIGNADDDGQELLEAVG
ncbi:MAG: restriction endonuclease subunit S [Cyanobacteria bacterium]|nr:restriction endonuclease subunit S [Cyanobacteriota bacterium]